MKESLTSRFVRFDTAEQNHLIKLGLQLDLEFSVNIWTPSSIPVLKYFSNQFFLANTSKYLKADSRCKKGDLRTVLRSILK